MADAPIQIFSSVQDVYPDLETATLQAARWNHLVEEFSKRFGRRATHILRAPGRVNLIGEHIDYALFGVFPAAIDRDILIACAPRADGSTEIHAQNLDGDKYGPQSFQASRVADLKEDSADDAWKLDIDKTKLSWESYVKAGYYGVLNHFFRTSTAEPTGFDLLVTGAVPAGSGLSSSAAMVVASTLTFLTINNKLDAVNKGDLVRMTMENEQRVGVNSGGMDQAASILGLPAHALHISFYPTLHPTQIPLARTNPPTCLVIANSLKVSEKAVTAKVQYNLRVVETLVGARVLARGLGVEVGPKEKITFREVLGRWTGETSSKGQGTEDVEKLEEALRKIDDEVEKILGQGNGKTGLTFEEMVEASGLDETSFNEVYLSWVEVEATHFQLYKRAKHVFSESLRVLEFRKISLTASSSSEGTTDTTPVHVQLGNLMDASQKSCAELFECSCPELDELTSLAKKAGAWGSRLTGAGWGGCTVSLVTESEVPQFIEKVSKAYAPYKNLLGDKDALEQVIFATKPGSGAGVYVLDEETKF